MKSTCLFVVALAAMTTIALFASDANAQSGAGPAALPASTVVAVRTIDLISSNGAASELEYRATVDDSIVVGGATVVPVGSPAFIRVMQVQQAGAVRGRASVTLRLVGLEVNGQRIAFNTGDASVASGSQGARATKAGVGGAVVGGILGGLLGGKEGVVQGAALGAAVGVTAAVVAGQSVRVPPETRLSFTLSSNSSSAGTLSTDDELRERLVALEHDGARLSIAGDRAGLDAMLDSGYTMVVNGRTLSREEFLSSVKPQPTVISEDLESPELRIENDRAALTGYYVVQIRQRSKPKVVRQKFRDVFTQREGRWLLLASEVVSQ